MAIKQLIIPAATALLILASAGIASAASVDVFSTQMTGSEEVPPVSTSMTGTTFVTNNADSLTYTLNVHNATHVMAAHLHCGARGQNGPVVAFLFGRGGGSDVSGELHATGTIDTIESTGSQCTPAITTKTELLTALRNGTVYANVHTAAHMSGEIRGQMNGMPVVGTTPAAPFDVPAFIQDMKVKNQQMFDSLNAQREAILKSVFND